MKTLDDYQIEARDYLLGGKFRCLFDEPGVGKTGPAIMAGWGKLLEDSYTQGWTTVLVTAPAYLLPNWEKEIKDFLPSAKVVRADGTGYNARYEALQADADFILTSYNNWSAKDAGGYSYPELTHRKWSAYIFDEGHRLRGRNSSWTKHVFRTRLSKSKNLDTPIWILTGTPFVRDGGDFFPYFHLADKKTHGSYWKFVNARCVVTPTPWDTQVGNIRKSYSNDFREELAAFSLRRTVSDIPQLQSLEFVESDYYVQMPASVVKAIKKAKKNYVLEHPDLPHNKLFKGAGALYVEQRKISTVPPTKENPKLEWLKDFLTDRRGKVVVYVWYKDSARAVVNELGRQAVLVTGDIPAGKRHEIVEAWKKRDGPQILIATIPSLSQGISLTEANDVVFLEHSELPADQEQCIKRLCRRGQKKLVRVHHVHARDTVDIAIKRVLDGREIGIQDALAKWIKEDNDEEWFN